MCFDAVGWATTKSMVRKVCILILCQFNSLGKRLKLSSVMYSLRVSLINVHAHVCALQLFTVTE